MSESLPHLLKSWSRSKHRCLLTEKNSNTTYREFFDQVQVLRARLKNYRLAPQSPVAVLESDYLPFMRALFACWLEHLIPVPVNLKMHLAKQQQLLRDLSVEYVIGNDLKGVDLKVIKDSTGALGKEDLPEMSLNLLGLVLSTSGTTGKPKGACLTLASVFKNAVASARAFGLDTETSLMVNTAPYYTSGLSHFLAVLVAGGRLVVDQGFLFANRLAQQMESCKCNGFGGSPTHFQRFVETVDSNAVPACLKFWISSGDHLPRQMIQMARKKFPKLRIYTVYGLTEVGGRLCVLDPKYVDKKMGSVGLALREMNVCIQDENGTVLKPGVEGEVVVEGPMLMQRYFHEKKVKENHRTGDYGYMDKDGFLWLRGRKDMLFKSGAEQLSAVEIQNEITALSQCREAVVMGMEHALLGKIPVAFVVLHPGARLRDLKKSARACLASSQFPKKFLTLTSIPRTGSGKPKYSVLKQIYECLERKEPLEKNIVDSAA